MPQDVEAHQTQREGYIAAASWLVRDADSETLVFRKFNKLAALNLLYMQSEILDVEQQISQMHRDIEDSRDMNLKNAARKWESLVEQSTAGSPEPREKARTQMELIKHLRAVIKDYREWVKHGWIQVFSFIQKLIYNYIQTKP